MAQESSRQIGSPVDRKQVKIEEPIRMTGAYTVEVHLGQGVNASVKIEVEAQE